MSPLERFTNGLVFGFDVGTASIAWAVRRADQFLDVGVLICPDETARLDSRRSLRRQRRSLRSRKHRRQWFARELAELLRLRLIQRNGAQLPLPESAWELNARGGWVPKAGFDSLRDPVALRVAAAEGEPLRAEELFTALTHLFRRRGYLADVPWGNQEASVQDPDAQKEEGEIRSRILALQAEMQAKACDLPCQLLDVRAKERALWLAAHARAEKEHRSHSEVLAELWTAEKLKGEPPKAEPRQRKEVWPRELLEREFRAIVVAQAQRHPHLAEKADWLLFGDCREVKGHRVYFKTTESRNPGVLGLKWPRFDNRRPGLDALEPYRNDPQTGNWVVQHTLKRENRFVIEWQLEKVLNDFTVVPVGTHCGKKPRPIRPPKPAMDALRKLWNERGHLWAEDLREWATAYEGQFRLRKEDEDLTPRSSAGRARFSKLGLTAIRKAINEARAAHDARYEAWERSFREKHKRASEEDIANGYARFLAQELARSAPGGDAADNAYARTVAPPPVLMLPGETEDEALRRNIQNIRDPRVRHRVEVFAKELRRLMRLHNHGTAPDFVVVELARDLMMNEEQKQKQEERNRERKAERDKTAEMLRDMGFPVNDENIRKFLLAQEVGWRCPFTLQPFCQSDFSNLTITQLVQPEHKPRFVREARSVFGLLEVEHLVPRTPVVCNEWFNLTVTLHDTNARKRKRTPHQWLAVDRDGVPEDLTWESVCRHAQQSFRLNPLKLQVFTSADAARIIEENAKRSIQQTAYIARCLRGVCLILFGRECLDWTDGVGRDPRLLKDNAASTRFLTTNGVLTARLRDAWKLNDILHPRLPAEQWEALNSEQKKLRKEERALKNRQDLRHHAIDAMAIACTLPWLAHKSRGGHNDPEDGWCEVDPQTSSIDRIWNPVFNDYGYGIRRTAQEKLDLLLRQSAKRHTDLLRHYKASQRRRQAFDQTLYGRRVKFGEDELGQTVFIARKHLLDLKTSHLDPHSSGGFIFSPLLREHIAAEWKKFSSQEANWLLVQRDWLHLFEREKAELLATGKNHKRTRDRIRSREKRIQELQKMEARKDWDELLKFIDKELGAQTPQPKFPSQFVATLRHPIYGTPIESVKVTAQSKGDDNFVLLRDPPSPRARSGAWAMRKQEDKYREMRVYRLAKPGRAGPYVCWLVLPWYGKLDSRAKRFRRVATEFMPEPCKQAKFVRAFRRDDIVCFANDRLASKEVRRGESWRIVRTDASGEALANIALLPAHQARDAVHPITGEIIKIKPKVVSLNDFMLALEPATATDELPHPPSAQSEPPGSVPA